jgi:hypothetical protein
MLKKLCNLIGVFGLRVWSDLFVDGSDACVGFELYGKSHWCILALYEAQAGPELDE